MILFNEGMMVTAITVPQTCYCGKKEKFQAVHWHSCQSKCLFTKQAIEKKLAECGQTSSPEGANCSLMAIFLAVSSRQLAHCANQTCYTKSAIKYPLLSLFKKKETVQKENKAIFTQVHVAADKASTHPAFLFSLLAGRFRRCRVRSAPRRVTCAARRTKWAAPRGSWAGCRTRRLSWSRASCRAASNWTASSSPSKPPRKRSTRWVPSGELRALRGLGPLMASEPCRWTQDLASNDSFYVRKGGRKEIFVGVEKNKMYVSRKCIAACSLLPHHLGCLCRLQWLSETQCLSLALALALSRSLSLIFFFARSAHLIAQNSYPKPYAWSTLSK